jgi:hypothetical protein
MHTILELQQMSSAPAAEGWPNSTVSISWPCPTSTLSIQNCSW